MSGHCCDNLIVDVLVKGCKKKIYLNSVFNIIKGNAVEVKKSFAVAFAGGSGSGKTTIINTLVEKYLKKSDVTVLSQDHYYRDLSHLSQEKRDLVNFDTPKALDQDLFFSHIQDLISGEAIQRPCYDFKSHERLDKSERVIPNKIII